MEITDILDNVWDVGCIGCAIASSKMVPPGGMIAENDSFYVHQDPEIPISGFLIIGSKRHVQSVTDLTEKEYTDFASLLYRSRRLLELLPDIQSVTLIQEERSAHFHFWLFPWQGWMIEKYGSHSLSHIRSIMTYAKTHLRTPILTRSILEEVNLLRRAATSGESC